MEFYIIKQGLIYLYKLSQNISCNTYAIVLLGYNSMYLQFTYLCCNFKFRKTPFVTNCDGLLCSGSTVQAGDTSGTYSNLMPVAFYNSYYSSWTSRKRALDSKISACLLSTENMPKLFTYKCIDHITLRFWI